MPDTPSKTPPAGGASRPKMRKPNRLRGPDAPAPRLPGRATFVPKLLVEVLPPAVRDDMPEEARDLFLQGYNYALEEYGDPERATHLGWAAVHRHFHRIGSAWVAQPAQPHDMPEPKSADDRIVAGLRRLHHR
jgi:cation transport regulator ChaB